MFTLPSMWLNRVLIVLAVVNMSLLLNEFDRKSCTNILFNHYCLLVFMWIQLFERFVCTWFSSNNITQAFACLTATASDERSPADCTASMYTKYMEVYLTMGVSCIFVSRVFFLSASSFSLSTNVPINEMDANAKSNYIDFCFTLSTLLVRCSVSFWFVFFRFCFRFCLLCYSKKNTLNFTIFT